MTDSSAVPATTDDCRACDHGRIEHWWQEPSRPDPILRCKMCESSGQTCLASYPGNPPSMVSAPGIVLCTTLNPDERPHHA